jgi:hypothetical protein
MSTARWFTSCLGFLGHYVPARHQNLALRNCGGCSSAKSSVAPQVDGDGDRIHASDCPKRMAGAGQLSLLVSPTIAKVKLYHVLIDGGAALNLISLTAFKMLQILMEKLQLSHPFSGVGPMSIMPHSCISLPATFGTTENFCTESVLFDLQRSAFHSTPFWAVLFCTSLWQRLIMGN